MKRLWSRLMYEPALVFGIPTVVFATAAGVWQSAWLSFAAAVFAGMGTLVTRDNVTPTRKLPTSGTTVPE